eukprot:46944-Prorocentrum_minimum.AAC.1
MRIYPNFLCLIGRCQGPLRRLPLTVLPPPEPLNAQCYDIARFARSAPRGEPITEGSRAYSLGGRPIAEGSRAYSPGGGQSQKGTGHILFTSSNCFAQYK